ncbi:unnamed protein product [Aphanomyces euteiches]|uniref:HOOK N-terminal domain-containing protein n=1 Tax=Aphanomyces euteiches TaxID=100861 RepID=A0A6G0W6Y5_9STRA|nr:hypothetical protein Ae201684_018092 [Aphanomyces euteiches]KAH9153326.1 hypothetical protein AeRB84_004397 [Aphanomyces euteiches]
MTVSALCEWVAFYAPPNMRAPSLCEFVANVVRLAFPGDLDQTQQDWDDVAKVLNRRAGELNLSQPLNSRLLEVYKGPFVPGQVSAAEKELERTLVALCVGAFKGPQQAAFIKDALNFSEHIQVTLFTLLREDEDDETPPAEDEVLPSTPVQEAKTLDRHDEIGSSCSKSDTNRILRENSILREENTALHDELAMLRESVVKLQHEDEKRKDDVENLKLELRVESAKNERAIKKEVEEFVAHLQEELQKATTKLQNLEGIENDLQVANEELDILRPAAAKTSKLEARLEKYQGKLDELTRMKEANRRLEEKTLELTDKTYAQETQIQKLSSVQRKLDETKENMTKMAVKCSELETLVSKRESEMAQANADLEGLNQELAVQLKLKQDMQLIIEQLQDSASIQNDSRGVEQIVDNDMQDELERLKRANLKLKEQLSLESADRVDSLMDELDSMTRIKKSFEAKFFDAQSEVERLQKELTAKNDLALMWEQEQKKTQLDLAKSTEQLNALQFDFERNKQKWVDDAAAWRDSESSLQANVQELLADIENQRHQIGSLNDSLANLQNELSDKEASILDLKAIRQALDNSLSALQSDIELVNIAMNEKTETILMQSTELDTVKGDLLVKSNELAIYQCEMQKREENWITKYDDISLRHEETQEQINGLMINLEAKGSEITNLERLRLEYEQQVQDSFASMELLRQHFLSTSESLSMSKEECDGLRNLRQEAQQKNDALLNSVEDKLQATYCALNECKTRLQAMDDEMLAMKTKQRHQEKEWQEILSKSNKEKDEMMEKIRRFVEKEKRGEDFVTSLLAKHKIAIGKKDDMIQHFELELSRLEAKNRLLEKDRSRYSNLESNKRHVSAEYQAVSLKMEMQLNALKSELEALSKEHSALQEQAQKCNCKYTCDASMKGYVDSMKHMEHQQQADSERRRELILMNAKLVQEQKQLVLRTTSQEVEMQKLKETINSLMLKEERRKKALEQEKENAKAASTPLKRKLNDETDQKLSGTPVKRMRTTTSPSSLSPKHQILQATTNEDSPPQCSQQ